MISNALIVLILRIIYLNSSSIGLKSCLGEVGYIFIRIVSHFLKWSNNLITVDVGINVLLVSLDYLGHAELDVWDVVLGSFDEDRDDVLGNLFLGDIWHHCCKGVQTAHSVVVASLVHGVLVVNDGNVILHDPLFLEGFGENGTLLNTHLTNAGSGVS